MPTIAEQLAELVSQKNALATNLTAKGVEASSSEKLNTLVPKVLDIQTGGGGADTSDATASAADIKAGQSAYIASGKVTGTMPTISGQSITPGTTQQTVSGGGYLNGNIVIAGDADLVAGNIKKDVEIFGVVGTLETSGSGYDTSDATATAADIISGQTAYINSGKVTGTYVPLDTSDATATSSDMKAGVTAYVDGAKVTGDAYTRTSQVDAVADGLIDGTEHWLREGFYSGIRFEAMPTLTPENIRNGVTIYGVTGTYSPSIITNIMLDTEEYISAADIADAYSSEIEVSDDGNFANWTVLDVYDWNTAPMGAYYDSQYKGVFYANSSRMNSAILFKTPVVMAAHSIIKYKYYVSTWINPTATLCLVSADSLADAKDKLANGDIAYKISLPCANTGNNTYVLVEKENVVPASYYICYVQEQPSGGNEAMLSDLSIIQL